MIQDIEKWSGERKRSWGREKGSERCSASLISVIGPPAEMVRG